MQTQIFKTLLFVTKVLTCGVLSSPIVAAHIFAAPHDDSPIVVPVDEKTIVTDPSIQVTPAPAIDPLTFNMHYYPFKESLSLRAGIFVDVKNIQDDGFNFLGGVQYLAHGSYSPQMEYGIDFSGQGFGYFHAAFRFIQNIRNSYRPYTKLGLTLQLDGGEKLATFLDHKNLFAKASIGFEDVLKDATSVRMEIDLNAGFNDLYLIFSFGYSFAW